MSGYLTYESSGVNIEANDEMVERIKGSVGSTFGPRVMDLHGGFAGLFSLEDSEKFAKNYKNPVLVSCTDGVGTKVLLAKDMGRFDTVGQDLVAMSVNDMIVLGAEPLFFLDYLAADKLKPEKVAVLVEGIASACREAGCSLIGGETAEMPGIYAKDDFDMAGFAVGVVEKDRIVKGQSAEPGDVIIGLSSSGVHSNGYSLVRNICFNKARLTLDSRIDSLGAKKLGDVLLEPTKLYVKPVLAVLEELAAVSEVKAMAHITGGGLAGNIPRVLPENSKAVIERNSWDKPDIFPFLQKTGPVEESEMYRVFNMGIGFVMVLSPQKADRAVEILSENGEKAWKIGNIREGSREVVIK
ncbi:Phosphoribosylformylglycinamidine cyclo-ligase [Sedimentisphaera cyanobacteriorum]|uniref:Phosphoribosylformylglycinamidine cyclo-ligase n=1 Tax=Sedimentisphaera cyanobacteriorum TaxID=1940790 RepID=A0A1Q2HQD6_9BACT|nr:phosphoribosylformylglycinamidine cyclo-ligase [Sedimentisphaera cyanobacteriorum]AQQ09667.1 Phosphoribosylformylglycinamidine cyclo-ligase [Sedimentisphaera cyanobacteriorum]